MGFFNSEVYMTYYERITYLIGEYNQYCTYLFSNAVKLILLLDTQDKIKTISPELVLQEVEVKSAINYSSFINSSFEDKKNLITNSKLSIKNQNKLIELINFQTYLNFNFFIDFDNGFESEDIKIYEKAISSITDKENDAKELNKEIYTKMQKLNKEYLHSL